MIALTLNWRYINYITHSTFPSKTDHRRYDLDLQETLGEDSKPRRIALAVIPFVALYRPAGAAISWGMGSCRVLRHLRLALDYKGRKEWKSVSKEVTQTALAIVSLTLSILNIRIGQLLTGSIDTIHGTYSIIYYTAQGEYYKASEEALQTIAGGLHVAFILTGSLEIILLSVLFQLALQLYQAKEDIFKERYIEAAEKLGMAAMRLNQASTYRSLIQKRNALFAVQKYRNFIQQAQKARFCRHLLQHNLIDLNGKIDENKVSLSSQEQEYDFGSHFHGYGKGLVKGANLAFRTVMIDGKELTECEFKVNHVFRDKLQKTLNELQMLSSSEIRNILQFTSSHAQSLYIEEYNDSNNNYDPYKEIYQIVVSGLGQVHIGASRDYPNLFDRVVVLMDRKKSLFDLYELLSLVNLDTAITPSLKEDLDRLKMGHLFRTFFPKEATTFERSKAFFTLPIQELLDKMIEKSPQMREVYNKYFHQIQETEILPGRIRYKIKGLTDEIQGLGGRHLTAAITGAYTNQQSLYQRAALMLSMGMLSQEMKAKLQINKAGGPGWDYCSGGADSIYTQMLTIKNEVSGNFDTSHLSYQSKVRILISLDALETGTYQHLEDSFGSRLVNHESILGQSEEAYLNRLNISEFTKTIQQKCSKWSDHEIMLKERIDPSYFEGFLVNDEETRSGLLHHLRACNLIQKDSSNRETIKGHLVEDFIRVSPLIPDSHPDLMKTSHTL
jgi:hypothetical protein